MRRFTMAGILLGIGFGGVFDGILLHQILHWHLMVSHIRTPGALGVLELNTLADGLFHAAACVLAIAGLWVALRTQPRPLVVPRKYIAGVFLLGWGLFNLIEGVVDHHVLQLHHVREGVQSKVLYDLAFLMLSATLFGIGLALQKKGKAELDFTPTA